MKKQILNTLLVSALSMAVCSHSWADSSATDQLSNKDKAIALLNSIETGDREAVGYVNPIKYIQHNLSVADGLAGFGELMKALPKGSAKVEVIRALEDGNFVVTQTDYNFSGPKVGFDVFRFENGLIVEHWDNLTIKSDTPNPSGHTQLDGAREIMDQDKTCANKAIVERFIDTVLVKGKFEQIGEFFDGDNYLQHNTQVADGLSGLNNAIEFMKSQGIKMEYLVNHRVMGEGNFVLAISEGKLAGESTSFYDLFRIENGKIAEHWDVVESILPKGLWKNENGKFGNLQNFGNGC
ncbi:hypothetical protein BTA51_14725 [Hahella sp. CCB-MM4]|uniref:nuclear transport factor 2 family protein n=1 Tax=Hahella sp. (strain CCB-MM4) TaxID=1926491 RepID=UPI000B9BD42A|nr:nuclear transport factor 2 family protein [Hahella sp. CCB-MM4]OZG72772.1 hypothetical protein BTA51_14725 [Hahella sp. CCB-MM4]